MAITAKVETITPEIAKEYLKHNSRNPRKRMDPGTIKRYADDIREGLWTLNGETIVFDEDGFLKNGQHRLCGVISAGKPIKTLVVRGIDSDITNFDGQLRRTITQNVNAAGLNVNTNIASAAKIIVNNFGPQRGQKYVESYIMRNANEFERAYRVVCYGGTGHAKSKCGTCVAAGYLALRENYMPNYEMEVFFRRFNGVDTWENDGYDISPAIVARRMFNDRGLSTGYQIQKEKLEIIVLAMQDFHNGAHRDDNYRISEPFHFSEWLDDIRRKDGID